MSVRIRARTVILLLKLCFATGVLSIPAALGVVGYGPGLILLALWSATTMCKIYIIEQVLVLTDSRVSDYSYVMYQFRMRFRGVHTIVDAAMLMGGPIARELASVFFLLTWM
jgi:amino acid permease